MLNRNGLRDVIGRELRVVEDLFVDKNESYGDEDDAFHNFRSTAQRIYGLQQDEVDEDDMFSVLQIYADKHLVALAAGGINTAEFKERCRDIVVYYLIAIALKERQEKKEILHSHRAEHLEHGEIEELRASVLGKIGVSIQEQDARKEGTI